MWYDIDFKKLAILLLPTSLRKGKVVAFAQVLLSPIAELHYQWKLKRLADWYKIEHTGQVCYLRKVLNDALDVSERRITISDGNSYPRKYIIPEAKISPFFWGSYLFTKTASIPTQELTSLCMRLPKLLHLKSMSLML